MNFPNTAEFVALNSSEQRRFLNEQSRLIDVNMLSGEDKKVDKNLVSWTVTSVTSQLILIDLEFDQPLRVSQEDYPDEIVVQASLSEYHDQEGQRLPISVLRTKSIPPQIKSKAEGEQVKSAAAVSSTATVAVSTIQMILAFVL